MENARKAQIFETCIEGEQKIDDSPPDRNVNEVIYLQPWPQKFVHICLLLLGLYPLNQVINMTFGGSLVLREDGLTIQLWVEHLAAPFMAPY